MADNAIPLTGENVQKNCWWLLNGPHRFAGRPAILLGRDLQSKLKEFISPIKSLDRPECQTGQLIDTRNLFRKMDRSSIFSFGRMLSGTSTYTQALND